MHTEFNFASSIKSLGFSVEETLQLLSSQAADDSTSDMGWGEVFDIRDDNLIWWNDLEKDKRYKSWPKSVREVNGFCSPFLI